MAVYQLVWFNTGTLFIGSGNWSMDIRKRQNKTGTKLDGFPKNLPKYQS